MTIYFRAITARRVEQIADEWAVQHVSPAFNGDSDAATKLASALSNEKRGVVAVAMWRAKVPVPAFAAFLREAWLHDHAEVIFAAQTRRTLQHMFRYAALPRPIAGTVRVWRGAKANPIVVRGGYSWTINRDMACWFALCALTQPWSSLSDGPPLNGKASSTPIVLAADVPANAIAWLTDDRGEQEAVILQRIDNAWIDGTLADWQCAAERVTRRIQSSKGASPV